MRKKSSEEDEIFESIANGTIEASMVMLITEEGERIYLHKFDDEIMALEFMEQMTASYRTDMIEKAIKRSTN
jgi:hypothetical protein